MNEGMIVPETLTLAVELDELHEMDGTFIMEANFLNGFTYARPRRNPHNLHSYQNIVGTTLVEFNFHKLVEFYSPKEKMRPEKRQVVCETSGGHNTIVINVWEELNRTESLPNFLNLLKTIAYALIDGSLKDEDVKI